VTEPKPADAAKPTLLPPGTQAARAAGFRLLRRLLLYHVGVGLALWLLIAVFPAVRQHLPIGGVTALATTADVTIVKQPKPDENGEARAAPPVVPAPADNTDLDRLGYARRLAICLVGLWLLMLPVSWVHRGIYRSGSSDHSMDEATMVLPGVVAAIVMVVQYSLALAFALAGIVAGVQFRRALQDTFDALFILLAIGTGIAAGVGALEVAVVINLFFCYATVYVCCFGDGLEADREAERKERKRKARLEEADD
jgi:hypothetical protein